MWNFEALHNSLGINVLLLEKARQIFMGSSGV